MGGCLEFRRLISACVNGKQRSHAASAFLRTHLSATLHHPRTTHASRTPPHRTPPHLSPTLRQQAVFNRELVLQRPLVVPHSHGDQEVIVIHLALGGMESVAAVR